MKNTNDILKPKVPPNSTQVFTALDSMEGPVKSMPLYLDGADSAPYYLQFPSNTLVALGPEILEKMVHSVKPPAALSASLIMNFIGVSMPTIVRVLDSVDPFNWGDFEDTLQNLAASPVPSTITREISLTESWLGHQVKSFTVSLIDHRSINNYVQDLDLTDMAAKPSLIEDYNEAHGTPDRPDAFKAPRHSSISPSPCSPARRWPRSTCTRSPRTEPATTLASVCLRISAQSLESSSHASPPATLTTS